MESPLCTTTDYQLDAWFDVPAYLTTMYFVDPSIICTGGRSQEQFASQGTGDRLVIQVPALVRGWCQE